MARLNSTRYGPDVPRFLDLVAWSEGSSTSPITRNEGYDIIVSGKPISLNDKAKSPIPNGLVISTGMRNRFDNAYKDHPNVLVQVRPGLQSSAAGRYQIMTKWWPAYKTQLHLFDFTPISQDLYAVQQLKEQKALDLIVNGDIPSAIHACNNIWASMPGNNYGQGGHTMEALMDQWAVLQGDV